MYANDPDMAKKWEKEEVIRGKLRNIIRQEIKEDNIKFSKEEMAQLHKDGKVEKGGHTIEFNESTKEYGKTLDKIAKDRQLKSISKKDRDTLVKIAKLMKRANESVNESDLGLTYKKGKTVKVTHKKSGKELIIIDKPNVKREYEKIGFFAEGKVNEGFDKYHLGGLLDSKLKKRLERAIKIWGGKVDAVGDDYIKFRLSSFEVKKFPALLKKLDRNKNVWIGDKRKNNIWDRRQRINKLEATTTVSVPGYLSPQAFSKSTQNAIDVDDEDDDKSESMAAPFRRRNSRGLGRPMKVGLNELSMAPFSSPEARAQINSDIEDMSKHLGKASQQVIKIMMNGVRKGKYTAMDISRGIKEGPAKRTHFGEMTFIQSLWTKMRDKFRRYSKHGKLS
jgi:hypothetical protein